MLRDPSPALVCKKTSAILAKAGIVSCVSFKSYFEVMTLVAKERKKIKEDDKEAQLAEV